MPDVQYNDLEISVIQPEQLFGIYRRLHDHVEGSGIGRYVVKRMVENAGRTIAVRSRGYRNATGCPVSGRRQQSSK